MGDGFDPTTDRLRASAAERPVRPVQHVERAPAARPSVAPDEAARAYREVERPPGPARATDATHLYVRQIMSHPVLTLPSDASAGDAAALMDDRGFRHVPVVDADGRLAGLVAESDLFRAARRSPAWQALPLARVMVADVLTLTPDMTLHAAAQRLARRGLAGGPVVDPQRRPVGFLSARDLLAVLVQRAPLTLWV